MASDIKLNSKMTKIKDIPWGETIYVDKIIFDQNLFKLHKERIDKVFANASQEERDQQMQNILLRDTLFNKAMEIIAKCYAFEISEDDLNFFIPALKNNIPKLDNMTEEQYNQRIRDIAEKLVQKQFIFDDIAKTENITVTKDEMVQVLEDYHKSTGLPIDDIKSDKNKLTGAVSALLEEKIIAYIINKFQKNLDELYKNMQKDMEEAQQREAVANKDQNNNEEKNNN